MDRVNQYKQRHVPFGSSGARMVRAKKIEDRRKERRAEHLSRIRNDNIDENDSDELVSELKEETREDRMTRLGKWKAERALKKKLEAKNKKPIFKVGVPHRNVLLLTSIGSPVPHCHRRNAKQCQQVQSTLPKRITRATEKRLASKRALLEYCDASVKSHVAESGIISKMEEKKESGDTISKKTDQVQYIAPSEYVFKGPSGLDPLPLFGRIWIPLSQESHTQDVKLLEESEVIPMKCESENSGVQQYQRHKFSTMPKCGLIVDAREKNNSVPECAGIEIMSGGTDTPCMDKKEMNKTSRSCSPVPAEFSPYIVTSRGKKSARREQRIRLGLNDSLADIIPTKDTVMQSMNISIEEEEKTAQYYKILLRQQIEKLTVLCEKWKIIQSDLSTTEDGKYMINQAIGQANLLMQKKFERFRGLVLDCETGKGEMLVRCKDLQAFWDIIMMQIKDCDLRFEKLSELQKTNWIENNMEVIGVKKKSIAKKKKGGIIAKSSAKAFIQRARKKNLGLICNNSVTKREKDEGEQTEAKYVIRAQDNSTTPQLKTHPLKNMEKLLDTSFTVMKVGQMGKTPEINLDSTISYVNSNQTPGRGILKTSENFDRDCIVQKSTYKVNFNETVMTNEKISDQLDDITSFTAAGKKLDFNDDTYDEENYKISSVSGKDVTSSVADVEVIPPITNRKCPLEVDYHPLLHILNIDIVPPTSNRKTPRKTRVKLIETPINDTAMFNTRVLRNRAIATDNSPMRRCSKLKKSNSLTMGPRSCPIDHNAKENDFQRSNQRRSSRRGVKFDVDGDCTACSTVMPALALTPKRNKKLSSFDDMNHHEHAHASSNGDLISFDSPVTPRRRSRRTSKK